MFMPLSVRSVFVLLTAAALGLLASGLVLGEMARLHPCYLCNFQRLLYLVLGIFAFCGVLLPIWYRLWGVLVGSTALGYIDLSAKLEHDPEEARTLLDAAGWAVGSDGIRVKDGQPLKLVVNEAAPQPRSFDVTTLVSQQWKRDLGVDLQILRADAGTYAKALQDPDQIQVNHTMVGRADLDVIKSNYAARNRNTLLNRDPRDNTIGD